MKIVYKKLHYHICYLKQKILKSIFIYIIRSVSEMGITNDDKIVVYDCVNIFSSARVYWQFKYFGH